jgi:hypothetical protein
MHYQDGEVRTAKRREFSRKTVLLGAIFIVTLVAGAFVGLDGVLEYYKLISGSARTTLETGAIISMASAVPFLAMGMSISADVDRNKWGATGPAQPKPADFK